LEAEGGDPIPDLLQSRRRGSWVTAALLAAGSVGALVLVHTMTDDVHRVMFAALGVALAIAAVAIVALSVR
jgi:hypothetical protein